MPSLDDTDRKIISVLEEQDPMRFTDIVDSLKGKITASPPKVSRKLKHLVQIGLVRREVTEDWPPKARYYINKNIKEGDLEPATTSASEIKIGTRESDNLKILLIMAFALVMVLGVMQGAFLSAISTGMFIIIGYVAYKYVKMREHRDKRLDLMDKRLQRIEKRLFE